MPPLTQSRVICQCQRGMTSESRVYTFSHDVALLLSLDLSLDTRGNE